MNPYEFKILQLSVVSVLETVFFILLLLAVSFVHSGPCDVQLVKAAAFHHQRSQGFLRVKQGKVIVDSEVIDHILFTITIDFYGFLLYDPSENMFMCWRKKNGKIVPKRNPRDLSVCTFEEVPLDSAYTKYVSSKYKQFVMSFGGRGMQRIGKKRLPPRKRSKEEAFIRRPRDNARNCSASMYAFCSKVRHTRRHKLRKDLQHLCLFDNNFTRARQKL